jgi:hypothetical protein
MLTPGSKALSERKAGKLGLEPPVQTAKPKQNMTNLAIRGQIDNK